MATEQVNISSPWVIDSEGIPQPRILQDYPGIAYLDLSDTVREELVNDPNQVIARATGDCSSR